MATYGQMLVQAPLGQKIGAETELALSVTAVTNTDLTLAIPPGASDVQFRVYTTTAFTAVTDAQISIGKTAGGAEYVAATTIKAIGKFSLTNVNAQAADYVNMPNTNPNIFVRIAQSGGSTAVGAATLVVSYYLPPV
jgi:hypothetical protein